MASTDRASGRSGPLFPRLTGGPRRMPSERVARHQKARLEGAMVEAVSRHGYAGTTVRELVTLAGVSKSTFYEHFENKHDCFLATFEEIVARAKERVQSAYREAGTLREAQMRAALSTFMQLAVERPAAAWLTTVESLSLGTVGVAHQERALRDFEALIRQSLDHSPGPLGVSDVTVRAIASGVRGVMYRRLREGHPERLPELVEELIDWVLRHQQSDSDVVRRAMAAAGRPVESQPAEEDGGVGWQEPPDSQRSRISLSQRERIIRGAARVVVDKGYEALSIPAISGAAGVSNATFYEHFTCKCDALLAGFQILAEDARAATVTAGLAESSLPERIGAGLRGLLQHIARNEHFARLAFIELPAAGPLALDQADEILDGFAAFLDPGDATGDLAGEIEPVILEAIATGIWLVIRHEIAHDRRESLPELAPEAARIAVTPLHVGERRVPLHT